MSWQMRAASFRCSSLPVRVARRSKDSAARELPLGRALSMKSLRRVTSVSWSTPVWKKPPWAGSWNWANMIRVRRTASASQRGWKVAS